METTTKTKSIDVVEWDATIRLFINSIREAFKRGQLSVTRQELKTKLHNRDEKIDALKIDWLGRFFLNLDIINMLAFLECVCDGNLHLQLPDIADWKERGIEIFKIEGEPAKPGKDFDMEDVRRAIGMFDDVNESSWFPLHLVYIRHFVLYACNNSTPDHQFGNYANWARYYMNMSQQDARTWISTNIINCA